VLICEPGEQASRRVENETLRCSGTSTLSSATVFEPEPRRRRSTRCRIFGPRSAQEQPHVGMVLAIAVDQPADHHPL
jgi:hypothetical protein